MQLIRKILFIQFSLDFISSAFLVLSSWTVFTTTGSVSLTGFYVSLGFLPSLLANIYIGAIIDRWEARKMLQISLFVICLGIICTMLSFSLQFIFLLFIAQMVIQLGGSIFRPSVQVYMTHVFDQNRLKYVFTKSASISILGGVIGTFIASQLVSLTIMYLFIVLGLLITPTILLSYRIPKSLKNTVNQNANIHHEIFEGFRYAFARKIFIYLFFILGSGQVITHCTMGFLAAYTYETFSNEAHIYGYLQIALTLGGIVLGLWTKSFLERIERYFSKYAFILLSISLIICVLSTHPIIIGCNLFIIGLLTTWIRSHYQAVQQMNTDRNFNGKMASTRMMINQGSVVIISPLLGLVGSLYGIQMIFLILAFIASSSYIINRKLILATVYN